MSSVRLTEPDYFEVLAEIQQVAALPSTKMSSAVAGDIARVTAIALRNLHLLSLSLQMELIETREMLEERILDRDSHCKPHTFTILNQLYAPFIDHPLPPLHEIAPAAEVGELVATFLYRIVGDYLLPDLEGDNLSYRLLRIILAKARPRLGPLFKRLLPDQLPGYQEQRGQIVSVFDALSRFVEEYRAGRVRNYPLSAEYEVQILHRKLIERSARFEGEVEIVQILHEVISLLLEPEALYGIFGRLLSDDFSLGDDDDFAEGNDEEFIDELNESIRRLVTNALKLSRPSLAVSGAYFAADKFGLVIDKDIARLVDECLRGVLESGSIPRKLEVAEVLLWKSDGQPALMQEPVDQEELERRFRRRLVDIVDFFAARSPLLRVSRIRRVVENQLLQLFFVLRAIVAEPALVSRFFYQYLLPVL